MSCAMLLLDALSFEGILGIISDAVCEGAVPDMLNNPGGVPLLIASAVRVAVYSEKYADLTSGTESDRLAAQELSFHFESGWAPIKGKRPSDFQWAIDIVLRDGLNDARAEAKKKRMGIVVNDNLILVQRAAFRLLQTTFGKNDDVDNPGKKASFGVSSLVCNPISDARNRVLARRGLLDMKDPKTDNVMRLCSREEMKKTLINLMNCVEEWLRRGVYCGVQINTPNCEHQNEEDREIIRLNASANEQRKSDFKREFKAARGGKAELTKERKKQIQDVQSAIADAIASAQEKECDLCVDAVLHANSAVAALFCQGFSLHHQMKIQCFLVNRFAKNLCADCNDEIHVIPSVMLNSKYGFCETCHRPRCFSCKEKAIIKEAQFGKRATNCMRCEMFRSARPRARDTAK